jgi:hypothetical protein
MRLRSTWLVVAGLVVFCAVACSGHLANDDRDGFIGDIGGGNIGFAGGGSSGRFGTTAGAASLGGRAGAPQGGNGTLPSPAGAAGWIDSYAGGIDLPVAGSGGDTDHPPNPCLGTTSCAGSFGDGGAAGGGDDTTPGECDSGRGCIVAEGSAISDLTADTNDLYWVDHGTFDVLGNYDNDGRLFKRGLVSGPGVVLASGLAGPVGVGLTTTHAFVYLDQVWQGKPRFSLARIPIAGGVAQIVQLDASLNGQGAGDCVACLVHSGDTLYFPLDTGIYKIAAQDAQPSLFSSLRPLSMAISGDYLYLVSRGDGVIWRVPLTGGTAEQLSADPRLNIQVAGGYVYSLDSSSNKAYLARMPATGGPWVRLPKARSYYAYRLQITGSWFFHELFSEVGHQFVAGSLDDTASSVVPLTLGTSTNLQGWVGTAQGIFWSNGAVIRQRFNTE